MDSKRFISWFHHRRSSHPVTPPPRDYPSQQEPIDSRDFQNPCAVQALATKVENSAVHPNAKRKREAISSCERPGKARKGNHYQPVFPTGLSDNKDVQVSNATNGDRYEPELDRNLRQWARLAATLSPLDDPFVDTPLSRHDEAPGSVAKSDRKTYLLARLDETEEKLERLQDSSKRMTRAQSRQLARLSDEYAQLCAKLHNIPLDLSPSTSSGLLPSSDDGNVDINTDRHMAAHDTRSRSVNSSSPSSVEETPHNHRASLNNNGLYPHHHSTTDSSSNTDNSTDYGSSAPAIPLRTLQDFEDYHQYQKIEFERTRACMYQDAPKANRQAREEKLFLLLAIKKRRLKKYWDPLSQRMGEMGSKRYIRLASRSPSDSAPGFYEKF